MHWQERNRSLGCVAIFFPELSGGINGSLDSSLEASTELVGATSLSGNRTGNMNHGFGNEMTPDLADANWADI